VSYVKPVPIMRVSVPSELVRTNRVVLALAGLSLLIATVYQRTSRQALTAYTHEHGARCCSHLTHIDSSAEDSTSDCRQCSVSHRGVTEILQ
jgi:hypothetical protein